MSGGWDGMAWAQARVDLVNRWLEEAVDRQAEGSLIREAMHYALMAGGKRLRPLLVLAAGEALDARSERWREPAVAVEFIHTYSLIHDDLPAMDDDDLRRGRPTCHKVFGEARAILAGDALQAEAFAVLAQARRYWGAEGVIGAVATLAAAAGARGLVDGQTRDLAAEGETLELDGLEAIHRRKTGALIAAAVRLPAVLAGDAGWERRLVAYGGHVGLAFQIADDILNVVGDPGMLGKPTGTDAKHEKATYPRLLGLEGARRRAQAEVAAAGASLQGLRGTEALQWLARAAVERER